MYSSIIACVLCSCIIQYQPAFLTARFAYSGWAYVVKIVMQNPRWARKLCIPPNRCTRFYLVLTTMFSRNRSSKIASVVAMAVLYLYIPLPAEIDRTIWASYLHIISTVLAFFVWTRAVGTQLCCLYISWASERIGDLFLQDYARLKMLLTVKVCVALSLPPTPGGWRIRG